ALWMGLQIDLRQAQRGDTFRTRENELRVLGVRIARMQPAHVFIYQIPRRVQAGSSAFDSPELVRAWSQFGFAQPVSGSEDMVHPALGIGLRDERVDERRALFVDVCERAVQNHVQR